MRFGKEREADRESLGLDLIFAQSFLNYMKTYALHWNYVGPNRRRVHEATGAQCRQMTAAMDDLAERMRDIGYSMPLPLAEVMDDVAMRQFKRRQGDAAALSDLVRSNRSLSELARIVASELDRLACGNMRSLMEQFSQRHEAFARNLESVSPVNKTATTCRARRSIGPFVSDQ